MHPVDFDDEKTLVPIDLRREAGSCLWDDIEHDGWGLRREGGDMTPASNRWDGISVTSIGYENWPMYTVGASSWVGAVYLHTAQFLKYRGHIEAVNRRWADEKYTAAELTSVRYETDRRYVGFQAKVEPSDLAAGPFKKISIYRAGTSEVAGTWYLNFDDPQQVDSTIEADALNEGLPASTFRTLGARIERSSGPHVEGYIFLRLELAAQLADPSRLGQKYGLVGPKLPFWLGN